VIKKWFFLSLAAWALAGCGGGGGAGTSNISVPPVVAGYPASSICTPGEEKTWVRAHLDDVYLWYREIVNVDSSNYATAGDYFSALLVRTRDRFSFVESQAVIDAFFQSGEVVGYGAKFVRGSNGRLRVAYSEPGSPARLAGVDRGTQIFNINGTPEGQLGRNAFLAALYPAKSGDTNNFDVLDPGAVNTRRVTLSATAVVGSPVLMHQVLTAPQSGRKVGYMVFNNHTANAEGPLSGAMAQFAAAGIDDLVLDMRYNGGGYLYVASEVGYMIGGAPTRGQVFEQLRFNDKHPEKTSNPANSLQFFDTDSNNAVLPTLGLTRVFVLTGAGTCSASESIINALSPFVTVITVGGATCGKPYGFIQRNNCGTAYFAIEFDGVNSAGQGGYVNGFLPTCAAADDLEHQFGDGNERLLKTALAYQSSGSCPASALTQAPSALYAPQAVREIYQPPWREMRLLTGR
jgi:C-terminal processing protease CtpA/Prc